MKLEKEVAYILYHNGKTTFEIMNQCVMVNYWGGWLYFYDENGNYVKANENTTTPIVVDSDTTAITMVAGSMLLGAEADFGHNSTTVYVYNQDGLNVSTECTVRVTGSSFASVALSGDHFVFNSYTGATIHISGETAVNVQFAHNDGPTSSATFTIWPLDNYEITAIQAFIGTSGVTGVSWASGQTNSAQTYVYDQRGVLLNDYMTCGNLTNYTGVTAYSNGLILQLADGEVREYQKSAFLYSAIIDNYYYPGDVIAYFSIYIV
jgi:hypothetical protein